MASDGTSTLSTISSASVAKASRCRLMSATGHKEKSTRALTYTQTVNGRGWLSLGCLLDRTLHESWVDLRSHGATSIESPQCCSCFIRNHFNTAMILYCWESPLSKVGAYSKELMFGEYWRVWRVGGMSAKSTNTWVIFILCAVSHLWDFFGSTTSLLRTPI